jgi:hypothetical protein
MELVGVCAAARTPLVLDSHCHCEQGNRWHKARCTVTDRIDGITCLHNLNYRPSFVLAGSEHCCTLMRVQSTQGKWALTTVLPRRVLRREPVDREQQRMLGQSSWRGVASIV